MIVLIPAYQPDEQLVLLAKRFSEQTDFSLVVVNDGSSPDKDAVFAALPPEVTVLRHEKNRGKGCAMKTGMAYIWEHFSHDEGVVVVDADGQHLLPDVRRVCEALHENPDALILGARRFTGNVPLRSKLGNTVTRYVFALASGVKIYDTQTGLRAFSVSRIPAFLALKGERYEYEMHMLLGAAQQHIPMIEVFIETVYLDVENSSSHFHPLRDSFRIYASILKFTCSSFAAFGIDYVMVLLLAFLLPYTGLNQKTVLLLSVVIARIISSLANFAINRKLVFKNDGRLLRSAAKYYAVAVPILILNYYGLKLLNIVLEVPLFLAKLIVEAVLFTASFILQRFFVFRNKPTA